MENRQESCNRLLDKITELAECKPSGILLREKDLTKEEYKKLAEQVFVICKEQQMACILHGFWDVAIELKARAVHLPMHLFRNLTHDAKKQFDVIGVSCHSLEEAKEAAKLGCTYIIAGHIFSTDCKKGIPPRGLDFLKNICENVSVPVYGIGGISGENASAVIQAGAKGVCVMSGWMQCDSSVQWWKEFQERSGMNG